MPLARSRTRRKGKANEESPAPESSPENAATPAQAQQMPAYAQGRGTVAGVPLLDGAVQPQALPDEKVASPEDELKEQVTQAKEEDVEDETAKDSANQSVTPVPDVSGVGDETRATAYSLTLQGRTDATFLPSSFHTERVRTSAGTGCSGCEAGDCVHVRGTLVSTYTVTTTVTLPSVNDFPDLTPCQRRRVQDAITRVLAPHEQRHVSAFGTYNGTTRQPFDMTICRSDFDAAMQSLHDAEQSARQAAAQARSDALDPFTFDVDLNCEEPPASGKRSDAGAPPPQAGSAETQTAGPGNDELET